MHIGKCTRHAAASALAIALASALACGAMPEQMFTLGGSPLLSHPEPAYGSQQASPTDDASDADAPGAAMPEGVDEAPQAPEADGSRAPAALATALAGGGSVVCAEVALADEPDPVVGSFTVDGMTFALAPGGVELVSASPEALPAGSEGLLEVPASVAFDGASYEVASIGAFAFYLSGAASVALPATASEVDERAFRSSDVERVEVDPESPHLASFDGCLYDSSLTRLLLIPGGRQGAVRIDSHAEVVPASAFSHCAGVTAISADAGGAAFSSWDGLLYDASGTTLLRVPAGATDITIREGCASIAAGAMEGCARLASIEAPATVVSVSAEVFSQEVETVALPASSLLASDGEQLDASQEPADWSQEQGDEPGAPLHVSSIVALTASDNELPVVDPSAIEVILPASADAAPWERAGMTRIEQESGQDSGEASQGLASALILSEEAELQEMDEAPAPLVSLQSANTYAATYTVTLNWNGATTNGAPSLLYTDGRGTGDAWFTTSALTTKIRQLTTLPTKTGYTFGGMTGYSWATGSTTSYINSAGVITAGDGNVKGTLTLTAVWVPRTYTVTLNANSGSFPSGSSNTLTATYDAAMPTEDVPVPTKSGWTFAGYFDGTGANAVQYYGYNSSTNIVTSFRNWNKTSTATLYARWTRSITLDRQGATNGSSTATVGYNIGLMSTITVPTLSGWTFLGYCDYNPSASPGGNVYQYFTSSGAATGRSLTTINTVYAWWVKQVTLSKYVSSATAGSVTSIWALKGAPLGYRCTTTADTEAEIRAKFPSTSTLGTAGWAPSFTGWTFAGYYNTYIGTTCYITSSGTGSTACPSSMPSTIYAKWERTISLSANTGTAAGTVTTVTATYGTTLPSSLDTGWSKPTKSGWTFAGYYGSTTGGTSYYSSSGARAYSSSVTSTTTPPSTLYAVWQRTISLSANTGTAAGTVTTVTATYGTTLPSSLDTGWSKPTKSGWTFMGYYNAATGSTCYYSASGSRSYATSITTTSAPPSTIYAKWQRTISLNTNGGTAQGSISSITATYGAALPDLGTTWKAPTRSGFSFSGYAGSTSGGTTYYNSSGAREYSSTITTTTPSALYAQWSGNTISLTWDANGGSWSDGSTSQDSTATYSTTAKVTLPTPPTNDGYVFKGWYTSRSGGTQITAATALPTANQTYYARWAYASWKITLDDQGATSPGSGAVYVRQPPNQNNKYYSDSECTAEVTTVTVPKMTDHLFLGYYPSVTSSNRFVGETGALLAGTGNYSGDTTLYARWRWDSVWRIALDDDGADVSVQPQQIYWNTKIASPRFEDEACTIPFTNLATLPEKQGYTFAGFYGASDYDGVVRCFIDSAGIPLGWGSGHITQGGTWTARWDPISFTIELNPNGEDVEAPESMRVVYDSDATLPSAARLGYIFMGWDTEGDGSGVRYQAGDACGTLTDQADETIELFAQWTPRTAADVPVEVTAQIDLLGVEEQVEATGWIESRSGGALKVAEVAFTPLAGAAELFGSRTADVFLEAFAEGSASADVSFALDAARKEADASKLAPFALPDGYGTRIGVGYRFAIPDDVLSSLDASRFEGVTTPVGQVVYTVALAE